MRLHGVDVVDRPALLPPRVDWTRADRGVPYGAFERALVVAWELLDTVPCPVLEVDDEGRPRLVLVEPATGRERLGGAPSEADLRWCERWWPLEGLPEGSRAEVGTRRDAWWAGHVRLLARLGGGLLLGVDYAHLAAERPPLGSLSGVPARPAGPAGARRQLRRDRARGARRRGGRGAAGGRAGTAALVAQYAALADLGVRGDDAGADELLDPGGLGGFTWLVQPVPG